MSDQKIAQASPEPIFDCLFILRQLEPIAVGATLGEVQAFAYLACLLSVFEGSPPDSWCYSFVALPPTLPYAVELTDAATALESAGLTRSEKNVMLTTERGAAECLLWAGLSQLSWRKRYLEGATGASLIGGVPAFGNDLSNEPQLQRATVLGQNRELLQQGTMTRLFEQFTALREAIGSDFQDLMTPAAVYLSFLSSERNNSTS